MPVHFHFPTAPSMPYCVGSASCSSLMLSLSVKEFVRVAKPGGRVCTAVLGVRPEEEIRGPPRLWAPSSSIFEIPTPTPLIASVFLRCAAPGIYGGSVSQGRSENIAVKHVVGELKFESAEEYWGFMTEIAAPVVAELAKADEPTRKRIEAGALDLARKTSPDGKPCLAWSASTIRHGDRVRLPGPCRHSCANSHFSGCLGDRWRKSRYSESGP